MAGVTARTAAPAKSIQESTRISSLFPNPGSTSTTASICPYLYWIVAFTVITDLPEPYGPSPEP